MAGRTVGRRRRDGRTKAGGIDERIDGGGRKLDGLMDGWTDGHSEMKEMRNLNFYWHEFMNPNIQI